jgi:hypothetical protein
MADLVALILGIAHYPKLPDTWHVQDDLTAKDAIAVTQALVARGVDPKKIRLFLSMQAELPADVAGVEPKRADKGELENFVGQELGCDPFVGSQLLFFCSGHGVSAEKRPETLIIAADSFTKANQRVFRCLGIEQLRTQLQGMEQFSNQLFCVNACRTPAEWAITGNDEVSVVETLKIQRSGNISQARFYAAEELKPAPVESTNGFSNGFAEEVVNCITSGAWPPSAYEWQMRLHKVWQGIWSDGVKGPDRALFKLLYQARHDLNREHQHKLAKKTFTLARTWNERRDSEPAKLWRTTLIDLHARNSDCLGMLMDRLERNIFTDKLVPDGVQRVPKWPERDQDAHRREKDLIEDLTYCLTEDATLTDAAQIMKAIADIGMRVVYVEIDGPCQPQDEGLVTGMIKFWRAIIAEAHKLGTRVPYLPLLLVGHIDPEPSANAPALIDTTRFYHPDVLRENDPRRLNLVAGKHLVDWFDGVFSKGDMRRPDIERAVVHALGGKLIEEISGVRMARVIEIVDEGAL